MKFRVNEHEWQLKFVKASDKNLQRSDGTWTFGVTDNTVKTVFILDGMPEHMTDRVILHELAHVHALEYDYSIPIEIEEIVCDFMSKWGRSAVYLTDDIMSKILRRYA